MKLYRGQPASAEVGEWWTTSLEEARSFAHSRGGRTFMVLVFDESDEAWLRRFLVFAAASERCGGWYEIPRAELVLRWRGVSILEGQLEVKP